MIEKCIPQNWLYQTISRFTLCLFPPEAERYILRFSWGSLCIAPDPIFSNLEMTIKT